MKERWSLASKLGFRLFDLNRWSMAYAAAVLMGLSACSAVKPISTVDDPVGRLIEIATHNDLLDEKNVLAALGGSFSLEPNPGQFDWIQYNPLPETRLARAELSYKAVRATGFEYVGILIKNLSTLVCYNRENLLERLNAKFSSALTRTNDSQG